jgi:2'-5' RNA ligase
MPFAIGIKADNDTARPIRALWDEVGRLEPTPTMIGMGYPPHVTLAIYDQLDEAKAVAALDAAFARIPAIRLTFGAIDWFENDPLVLWAVPGAHGLLQQAHAAVHRMIGPMLCRPHYRPGHWVPHCTLGTAIPHDRRDEARAMTQRVVAPFEVTFDTADVVRFLPVEVIREQRLG